MGRCCPDCSAACQQSGIALAQVTDRGDQWWGEPFDDGINTQAAIFAGDECCPDCAWCPICQGH